MDIAILGLAQSGKTTLFRALTGGRGEATVGAGAPVLMGVVKVPDPRLGVLAQMFHPQKVVPSDVRFLDVVAPPSGLGKTQGFSGPILNQLGAAAAFVLVVRAFKDEGVPHLLGSVDPHRDLATLNLELAFSDLGIMERRLQRIAASYKGAKPAEREALDREQALLERLKAGLEAEKPVRQLQVSADEARFVENYALLTARPMLVVVNVGEDELAQAAALEAGWSARYGAQGLRAVVLCAKLEMELALLEPAEAVEFRRSLGAPEEPAIDRLVRLSYQMLGLASFLTVGEDEVRAWTVVEGTPAVKAAGKVHSDIERGFIRAEVIGYDDLVRCGSLAEARKRGLLRLEGKTYPVKDGDVINYLFNV
ncbi:MAG: redox-regulated ATPase YchF [Chloroflexi bacterium]|nr:redox-regulated ATPase YchF [Chloroflexota bacterium]